VKTPIRQTRAPKGVGAQLPGAGLSRILTAIAILFLATGCPRIDSRNPKERLRAVKRVEDQQKLASLALEDPFPEVRNAAFARVTDEETLAGLATQHSNPEIAHLALGRIKSDGFLLKVARSAGDGMVRIAAADRLPAASLKKLALDPTDESLASNVVIRMTEQAELAEVALRSSSSHVRMLAANRMTDQPLLARVVRETGDEELRRRLVENLSDPQQLRELVRTTGDPFVRVVCRVNLVRAGEMAGLAPEEIREAELAIRVLGERFGAAEAAAKIRDQQVLAYLAERTGGLAQMIAHLGLVLQDELIAARRGALDISVRHTGKEATYVEEGSGRRFQVGGEFVGISISQGGEQVAEGNWETTFPLANPRDRFLDAPVELAALLQRVLMDPKFSANDLKAIYERTKDQALRQAAVRNLRDDVLLESIARNAQWVDDMQAAAETLSSPEILAALAADPSVKIGVRMAAVRRITDPAVLEKIARGTDDYYLRVVIYEQAPELREKIEKPDPANK